MIAKSYLHKIFGVILTAFLAGCSSGTALPTNTAMPSEIVVPTIARLTNEIRDGGFLSGEPCGAPCFFGITPGLTTEEETRQIVGNNNLVFKECIDYGQPTDGGISCQFTDIGIIEEKVVSVSFISSNIITLQKIIDRYGSPDAVYIWHGNLPDQPAYLETNLYFDQIKTVINLHTTYNEKILLDPSTRIMRINYLTQEDYEFMHSFDGVIPWNGFGEYSSTNDW